jgi:hypothetical protein
MQSVIATFTGKLFDLAAPDPGLVDIRDIARGLSLVNRWGGQTRQPFSVAQHSVMVAEWCEPRDAAYALLHDAAEAYIGDITRPVKSLLPEAVKLETSIQAAILAAFGVDPDAASLVRVREWDDVVLASEAVLLFPKDFVAVWPLRMAAPAHNRFRPLAHWAAERLFLDRFWKLSRNVSGFAAHLLKIEAARAHRDAEAAQRAADGEESQTESADAGENQGVAM